MKPQYQYKCCLLKDECQGNALRAHIRILAAILYWRPFSELNVDNWNDNCEAKSEAKSPRPLRGL